MLFARFRSKSRNLQTDEARFRPVSLAVVSAIDECARELAGLRRRMDAVRKTAAFLMDTDQDGCSHHDSQIACAIHKAEGSLLEAELRASTLGSQMVILHKLSVDVDGLIAVEVPGGQRVASSTNSGDREVGEGI